MAIRTERLLLRPWCDTDEAPFVAMGADPEIMRFFERTQAADEVRAMIARIRAHHADHGFCFWAAELPGEAAFIGTIGLGHLRYEAHFTPAVEIGWRLARPWWGRGLATEGAAAALADAFSRVGLDRVVAVAVEANAASLAVMKRIGMMRDRDGDFDHPMIPEGHSSRRHVLHRVEKPAACAPFANGLATATPRLTGVRARTSRSPRPGSRPAS